MKIIIMTLLSTALAFVGLWGCNDDEIIPIAYEDAVIYHIDTSQIVNVFSNSRLPSEIEVVKQLVVGNEVYIPKGVKLHGVPKDKNYIEKIKNKNLQGKPLKYLAIGSSLTAGVRDGGYFNEGMMTSFPNLLARQLGIEDFKMPLFDETEYNGTGRKIRTDENPSGGPFQKFNISSNNLGIESIVEEEIINKYGEKEKIKRIKLKEYKGYVEDLDAFALPGMQVARLGYGTNDKSAIYLDRLPKKEKYERSFWDGYEALVKKKVDVFTIEMGSQGFIAEGSAFEVVPNGVEHPAISIAKKMIANGAIGCVANVPDYSKFPVYHQIKYADLKKAVFNSEIISPLTEQEREMVGYIPNSKMDSMMSPKVNIALKKLNLKGGKDILSSLDIIAVSYNSYIESALKGINVPMVDLYALFENIVKGNYVTHDGIKVDVDLKTGNFFSSDGIYPTPFGNAIIANEYIRTLNKAYRLNIPLIPTKEYL
ncbi:MAG: hypothetical protein ACI9DJ_000659 [Algoriphagus sp.]|jgi:hypothetical protein